MMQAALSPARLLYWAFGAQRMRRADAELAGFSSIANGGGNAGLQGFGGFVAAVSAGARTLVTASVSQT